MLSNCRELLVNDDGAVLAEYGMLVLLIAVAASLVLKALGPTIAGLFAPAVTAL